MNKEEDNRSKEDWQFIFGCFGLALKFALVLVALFFLAFWIWSYFN